MKSQAVIQHKEGLFSIPATSRDHRGRSRIENW